MRHPSLTVPTVPMSIAVVAIAMGLLASAPAVAQQRSRARDAPIAALDAYVAGAVRDWRVPGLAIAVIHGDTIVLAKGYGVRRIGRPEPVDAHTLFAIGSTTKAMTATLMAMLVDSGRVSWDDPVINHLPEFRVQDPYVTREMTVRDLLTHRGGLPETDYLWEDTTRTFTDILRRLQYVSPAYSIRSAFVYQNVMYATAGHIEAVLAGTTWDDLVRRRVFTPLGMADTKTSTHDLDEAGNVATPHARVHDTLSAIPWRNLDDIAPAGSVNSSVTDMAHWLRFVLDSDRIGGNRIVSAASFHRDVHAPSRRPGRFLSRVEGRGTARGHIRLRVVPVRIQGTPGGDAYWQHQWNERHRRPLARRSGRRRRARERGSCRAAARVDDADV